MYRVTNSTVQYVLHEFWRCAFPRRSTDPERPHVGRFRPGPLHREGQHMRADPASPVRARKLLIAELFRLSANIPALSCPTRTARRTTASRANSSSTFPHSQARVLRRIVSLNIREPPFTKHGPVAAHVTASPFLLLFLSLSLSRFCP